MHLKAVAVLILWVWGGEFFSWLGVLAAVFFYFIEAMEFGGGEVSWMIGLLFTCLLVCMAWMGRLCEMLNKIDSFCFYILVHSFSLPLPFPIHPGKWRLFSIFHRSRCSYLIIENLKTACSSNLNFHR